MGTCKLPAVVLVRPRNPNNIGAAARAMANFGFTDLRIVSPHPPVWEEARTAAVGADDILARAKVFPTLKEAVLDRRRVFATSCMKARRAGMPVLALPGLRAGSRDAIVFGPEKTGLPAADIEHCDAVIRIPTLESFPSMNLAAAAAVVCYELAGGRNGSASAAEESRLTTVDLERLIEEAERVFLRVGYRKALTPEQRKSRARRLLRRRGVQNDEAGFLFELARRITGHE
ncbi:MAG: RNA methyltransferase [Elusimicrobia bacterium]|nr:RNA methyltransferase [Elusimicrobiota bacterium]